MENFYSRIISLYSSGRWLLTTICLLSFTASFSQDIVVKGKISDSVSGESLPGTTILVKGTTQGATADLNGEFTITAPADATLIISFIGYVTQEVLINNRTTVDVTLAQDAETLQEVVVVGYGSVEKKDVTGVVAKVNEGDFNKGIITAPDKLIDGKVAGLQMTSNGDPGGGTSIRLRGVSINGQTPLFVVDGVPLDGGGGGVVGGRNPLNFINPNDVADITVLKDASASAIYGARGANGVIIITTKSGQTGKPKVSYNAFFSASFLTRRPDVLSPKEYRAAIVAKAPQVLDELGDYNTDWMKEVTQTATSMSHNVTVSGGVKKTGYYASINYMDTQGVLRFTQNKKLNLSLKLTQKFLNDKLSVTINTKNGFTWDLLGPNVMGAAAAFDPTQSVYDVTNVERGGYFQWNDPLSTYNPVASQEQQHNNGKTFRTLTNVQLDYKLPFVDGLSLRANIGYDRNKGSYDAVSYPEAKESQTNGAYVYTEDQVKTTNLYEYYANYKKTFGSHSLDLSAGYAYQNFKTEYERNEGSQAELVNGEWVPTENIKPYSLPVENRIISFFSRLNYDYKGKYLVTGSIRRDGSSRFSPDNRWGLFPAVAVGWRVLEENFTSGLQNVFSELKLRAGYGVTGNEQIGNYLYSTYYRYSLAGASYQFGNDYVKTLRPIGVDPNIKWEETASANIGVDAGFLKGRMTASLDFYVKNVNDLLFSIAVPAGSNLSDRVTTNIGQVKNTGAEITLTSYIFDRPGFKWTVGLNTSYNKNKIVKLDNLVGKALTDFPGYESGGISGDVGQFIQVRKVGEPIDAFSTYINNKNPDGTFILDPNGDGVQSALELYRDINKDGIINEKDKVINHKPNPDVLMGITSSMTIKKFDVSFTLKGSFGNYVYNNVASANGYFERLTERQVTNNIHASAFETGFKKKQLHSEYYVQNGSFVKLDNVSIGYNFDPFKFGKIRTYITGQNLLVLTPYKGVDPEIFGGIDNNLYPRSITVSVGVSVTFK